MRIISHRGLWLSNQEKNSYVAFNRSFKEGFGTETDVRDFNSKLVISHDTPCGDELSFRSFLDLAKKCGAETLALNVKADGLAHHFQKELLEFDDLDYFFFDMSVPDMRAYFDYGLPVFTRMSEVERNPAWLDRAAGVWLDCFESEWFKNDLIIELLNDGKQVCLVSPELHGRDNKIFWEMISEISSEPKLILCTDFPLMAMNFFRIDN
jgi:hypothetical protein